MEQFSEVTKHLQKAYIAAAGNPNIGMGSGHTTNIGNLIVAMSGPQALFEAQRQANVVKEEIAPTVQKKSQRERKPTAYLMNASENPVLQNKTKLPVVAGNAKQVPVPSNAVPGKNTLAEMMESEESKELNERISNALEGSEFRMAKVFGEAPAKNHDSEVLKEFAGEPEDSKTIYEGYELIAKSNFVEGVRILNLDEYEGKTPKYVADNYSQEQIEKTLTFLEIDFDPTKSAKQKAKILIDSIDGK